VSLDEETEEEVPSEYVLETSPAAQWPEELPSVKPASAVGSERAQTAAAADMARENSLVHGSGLSVFCTLQLCVVWHISVATSTALLPSFCQC